MQTSIIVSVREHGKSNQLYINDYKFEWVESILFYSILFYSILLYYIILYYIILYHIILYHMILYYIILYYIILYYIVYLLGCSAFSMDASPICPALRLLSAAGLLSAGQLAFRDLPEVVFQTSHDSKGIKSISEVSLSIKDQADVKMVADNFELEYVS